MCLQGEILDPRGLISCPVEKGSSVQRLGRVRQKNAGFGAYLSGNHHLDLTDLMINKAGKRPPFARSIIIAPRAATPDTKQEEDTRGFACW